MVSTEGSKWALRRRKRRGDASGQAAEKKRK
jgi:hypothetical protein